MTAQNILTLVNPVNGNLAFQIFSFEDNSHFDHLQRLSYYSVVFVTEGDGILKVDVSEHPFSQHALMCFSPYQPFMFRSEKTLKGIAINFHPDFFCIHKHQHEIACNGVLFNNIYEPPILPVGQIDIDSFKNLIEQMKVEMKQAELAQYELLISYLKILLINASRLKVKYRPEALASTASQEPFILQNLKEAIEAHYRQKHSASEYADLLNISAKALARITRNYFNKTLTNLISERIIIEAKRELYLTAKPVKAIARELGFNDEYYFSRFFKNNADVSPQLYRETVGYGAENRM